MVKQNMTRRQALHLGASAAAALAFTPALRVLGGDTQRLFKIGACDWSLGKRQDIAALQVAKDIGLDGVQVSFGAEGGEYDLRKPGVRRAYATTAEKLGVEIAALAMGILNQRPYASDPDAEKWVVDCVDVMAKMKQHIVLLAFFSNGDINHKPDAQKAVIERLKKVAPRAEKAGVILGIESTLNADDHLRILDAVGSPSVQVYYDVANMTQAGYDIYKEIRQIGRDRICQIHAKENGVLLGKGKVDFPRVKEALDDIGWSGWLIIEGARTQGKSIEACYKWNQKYLRSIFPTGKG